MKQKLLGIAAVLFFLMLATRTNHFGSAISLPDASLAVFFLAGFYLRRLWVFLLFCVAAAGIDYWAINMRGGSGFCVSRVYGFLLPAYFVVWWTGQWTRTKNVTTQSNGPSLIAGGVVMSVSLAFLISNGSFYWLSGHFADLSSAEYFQRVVQYYPRYFLIPLAYLSFAALFHYLFAGRKAGQVDHA